MKKRYLLGLSIIISQLSFSPAGAQTGAPYIHDPSTIAECDGKYYTFGTGGGGLISENGWSWHSGAERPGGGAAPDVLKIGDRYLVIYGATGGGLFGGHNGRILTMWNKTLDPQSTDFHYTAPIEVASSDGMEDCDAIDPSLLLDPTTGRLWVTYGTYFGNIRLIELDPATGERVKGNLERDIAIDCEATDLIYRNGWYYLLGTHGTCCDGVNSTYNIVVGRSRSVEGPYLDNIGRDMLHGGGRMVVSAGDRKTGPGHFGRTIVDEGVEIMSCHYEADFDQGGRSVLGIRPLLWHNDWPVAGDLLKEGTFAILSERRGYSLELAVDFVRMEQERKPFWQMDPNEPIVPVDNQTLDEVQAAWPDGEVSVRCADYMFRPHQLWHIRPVPEAGGTLCGPLFTISIDGTNRALTATADLELTTKPADGSEAQLWRIEQLTDGTYRIMPYRLPGSDQLNTRYCLYSAADSMPTLAEYDFKSDNSKWRLNVNANDNANDNANLNSKKVDACIEKVNMPLFQTKYTADPSPLVVGDTLFLYTSHDASPEDIPDENEKGSAGFFMYDWLLWSTTDMVNWTEHGAVASLKDFAWRSRENGAWAIQTVERNGKYYLYAPLHGHGIGVLVSDSPYGPFRDPLGKPLVWNQSHWYDIDPTVFVDDDGQAYMYWGNPHTYYARLNDDMVSLKDSVVQLPYHIEHYQEGPWFYKRNGHYYLGYATTCCPEALGYAMSDSPTGPWEPKGYIMKPTDRDRGNHPGICDYKGHSYIFGQSYDLMHLETYVHHERRSVSATEITYQPDGTIGEVPYWLDQQPLRQLHWLNPYQRVEAETMAWGYGLKTAKMGIPNTGVVADMPASTGRRNMYVFDINNGEYIRLRGVDFASGAKRFNITAAAKGKCQVTLRIDSSEGPVIGKVNITDTGSVETYQTFTDAVSEVLGVHDLYLCFSRAGGDVHLDWWQFEQG